MISKRYAIESPNSASFKKRNYDNLDNDTNKTISKHTNTSALTTSTATTTNPY